MKQDEEDRALALLREIGSLSNLTQADAELQEVARTVRLFHEGNGPEAHQFRGCVQVLAQRTPRREESPFGDLSDADAAALQASCAQSGEGRPSSKACAAFAETAQVMMRLAPPAWLASADATCAFAVNFLLPAGEEPACMRVMHAVSLDVARQQHRGGLQQSAWPWVATSPSFAEVFHAACEKEIPGLDCVTAAAQLQAMSSALVQRGPVSGSGLPRYHRAACGAMQLLSKGGAAPAEPKTQRAQVRQALEVALAEEGPEHSLHEPEASARTARVYPCRHR